MFYRLAAQQKTNITPFVVAAASPAVSLSRNPDIATSVAFSGSNVDVTLRQRYSGGLNSVPIGGQIACPVDDGGTTRYIASASTNAVAQVTAWGTSAGTPITTFDAHVLSVRARHNQTPDRTGLYNCLSDIYGLRVIPFYIDGAGVAQVGGKYFTVTNPSTGTYVVTFRRLTVGAAPVVIANSIASSYVATTVSSVSTSGFTVLVRNFAGALTTSGIEGFICYSEGRGSFANHEQVVTTPFRDATLFYLPVANSGSASIPAPYSSYFSATRTGGGVVEITFAPAIPIADRVSVVGCANADSSTGLLCTAHQPSTISTNGVGVFTVNTWSRTTGAATDGNFFVAFMFYRDTTVY